MLDSTASIIVSARTRLLIYEELLCILESKSKRYTYELLMILYGVNSESSGVFSENLPIYLSDWPSHAQFSGENRSNKLTSFLSGT